MSAIILTWLAMAIVALLLSHFLVRIQTLELRLAGAPQGPDGGGTPLDVVVRVEPRLVQPDPIDEALMLLFVSRRCSRCEGLVASLAGSELRRRVRLVGTSGSPSDVPTGVRLADNHQALATALRVRLTPAACIVHPDGSVTRTISVETLEDLERLSILADAGASA
jgi:hypothetical protein